MRCMQLANASFAQSVKKLSRMLFLPQDTGKLKCLSYRNVSDA